MIKASQKRTIKKYLDRIENKKSPWTKLEINSFKKLIGSMHWMEDAEYKNEILNLWGKFTDLGYELEYDITKEQSEFGINWLKKQLFKSNGEPRNNKKIDELNCDRVRNIVKSFKKFTFVGYHMSYRYGSRAEPLSPVYRVYSKNGEYFDYTIAGQWGEILSSSIELS